MMTAIRGLLSSKKFWSAILGSVIAAVSDHLGIDQQTVFGILGLFGVQIAGQGNGHRILRRCQCGRVFASPCQCAAQGPPGRHAPDGRSTQIGDHHKCTRALHGGGNVLHHHLADRLDGELHLLVHGTGGGQHGQSAFGILLRQSSEQRALMVRSVHPRSTGSS